MEQNGKIHTILVLLELQRSLRHQVKPQDSVMFDHSSSVTAVAAATSVQLQPIDFLRDYQLDDNALMATGREAGSRQILSRLVRHFDVSRQYVSCTLY